MRHWGDPNARRLAARLAGFGLWSMVLAIAFCLQVVPVTLVVSMFAVAVGLSIGAELIAVPAIVLAIVLTACLIASRRRSRWGRRVGALPQAGSPVDRSDYFPEFRRLR